MIRNLLFDFGGVLCDLNFKRCMDSLSKIGFPTLDENTISSGIFQQINIGEIGEKQFFEGLRELGNFVDISDKELLEIWNSIIETVPDNRFEALLKLKEHFHLYLLSNVNVMHWDYCTKNVLNYKGANFTENFDRLFLSYKMHKEKPDKEIFEQVLQETGIHPEETLFIDDRLDNISTAHNLGFQVLQALGDEWIEDFRRRKWL